jgi:hypothetical protein
MTAVLVGAENLSAVLVILLVLACWLAGIWAIVDTFLSYGKARLVTKPQAPGLASTRTAVR